MFRSLWHPRFLLILIFENTYGWFLACNSPFISTAHAYIHNTHDTHIDTHRNTLIRQTYNHTSLRLKFTHFKACVEFLEIQHRVELNK